MSAVDQVLAEVDTDGKVLVSSIDLGLESLMVVHQQLHTRHVPAAQSLHLTALSSRNSCKQKKLIGRIAALVLDAANCYRCSVVCASLCVQSPTKITKSIEVQFGVWTWVEPRNHVLG